MNTQLLIVLYSALVAAASLAGGWLPNFYKLSHTRLQMTMSLVAGLMLGVGLWHLLPHGVVEIQTSREGNALDVALWWLMIGLVTMFFLIRAFHIHHHGHGDVEADEGAAKEAKAASGLAVVHDHVHGEHCAHDHDHEHGHGHSHGDDDFVPKHPLAWMGLFFGLALHTLIDGVALGASVSGEAHGGESAGFIGLGTFLAIALHKPLDALSIQSLMRAGGWSDNWRAAVNLGFALMCPIGALIFFFGIGADVFGGKSHLIVGCALAFSAGVFLCISLGDLLPELHFHSHDQAPLSFALVLGIALAYGIRYLEPEHAHGPPTKPPVQARDYGEEKQVTPTR